MREADSIIGQSSALTDTLEQVSQLAAINRPILVLGERGTGKELAAERLHYLSPRWDAPHAASRRAPRKISNRLKPPPTEAPEGYRSEPSDQAVG